MTPPDAPPSFDAAASQGAEHLLPDAVLRREAKALLIDGELATSRVCQQVVAPLVAEFDHAANLRETLLQVRDSPYHVILVDVNSGDDQGQRLQLCRYLAEYRPDTSVVILSDANRMETAIAAMRAGAFDLVQKPLDRESLAACVRRATSHALVERRLHQISDRQPTISKEGIVGDSATVQRLMERIARVADTDVTVLITGESGTGKELVARALHHNSARKRAPFVPINCAAIPSELLEAELFGHAKGAFTDAKQAKEGMFVRAGGGTLFLDEIGEMPPDMQVKLLRALQERRVRPVGGDTEVPFDIRIVAATNRDLEQQVSVGNFREDLYYRLNVVRLQTPPLRERGHDILLLASHFLQRWAERMGKRVTGISSDAIHLLLKHQWPGNVRELENVMQRAVALAQYDEILPADLGELGAMESAASATSAPPIAPPIAPPVAVAPPVASATPVAAPPVHHAAAQPGWAPPAHAQPVAYPPAGAPAPSTAPPPAHAPPGVDRFPAHHDGPAAAHPGASPGPAAVLPTAGAPDLEQYMQRWLELHLRGRTVQRPEDVPSLVELEQIYVCVVLDACGGNKTQAAEVLGMARRTLYRRLKQIDDDKKRGREASGTASASPAPPSPPSAAGTPDVI